MRLFYFLFLIFPSGLFSAQNFWQKVPESYLEKQLPNSSEIPLDQCYSLEFELMSEALWNLKSQQEITLSFPNNKGEMIDFIIKEYSNFEPDLQARFPKIKSYVGKSLQDPSAYLRISINPDFFSGMILRPNGNYQYIEKVAENQVYAFYQNRKRNKNFSPFKCLTDFSETKIQNAIENSSFSSTSRFQTYRLAISTDGLYADVYGGTIQGILAGVNATLTRVNGVFEVDLALHLNLINSSTNVMYLNSLTDPYSNLSNFNSEVQNTLTSVVGEENYDIGHLFSGNNSTTGNAGCIGCICQNGSKGRAFTSGASFIGDTFDIDYVAHEMGHQLGGNHSFSHNNEFTSVQVEPGSGSTIMGYAGYTGNTDVQQHSDPYFSFKNIVQIQNNLFLKPCAINTTPANQTPVVDAGADYTIPIGTAFKLEGTAQDDQLAALTYNWEQDDDADILTEGSNSFPGPNKTTGPNFRSVSPTTEKIRYFPHFNSVLNGNLCPTWECISEISRTLHFAFTARDNQAMGQTSTDYNTIMVNENMGPFVVNSPNENMEVPINSTIEVLWEVANTNSNPVNCQNVNILISNDGGQHFTTLVENTPNDGAEIVDLSGIEASLDCVIMVEAADNIFYALSPHFFIGYSVTQTCNDFNYQGNLSIEDGTGNYSMASIMVPPAETADATISKVSVFVDITHTYIQDLKIFLQSPQSTEVTLWNFNCGSQDNMMVTFEDNSSPIFCDTPTQGTYLPFQPLSGFEAQTQEGSWLLGIADFAILDIGHLNSATLSICSMNIQALDVKDLEDNDIDFVIYPNPATDYVKIKSETLFKSYRIYNEEGRLVAKDALLNNEIPLHSLPIGSYILQLNTYNNQFKIQKFIKSN